MLSLILKYRHFFFCEGSGTTHTALGRHHSGINLRLSQSNKQANKNMLWLKASKSLKEKEENPSGRGDMKGGGKSGRGRRNWRSLAL
jgi:hypothetical protein